MIRRLVAPVAALTLLIMGCGHGTFSPHFRDNNLQDLKSALANIKPASEKPANVSGKALVFLVTNKPTSIVAYDLNANKQLWRVKDDVSSKIVVGRTTLFHRAGTKTMVARSIASGQKLWSLNMDKGDRLLGHTTDGVDLYYVTEHIKRAQDGTAAYLVAVAGDSGRTRWIQPSAGRLGAPSAMPGIVILPLRSQSMAIVSTQKGEELARIRSKEEMVIWVRNTRAGVLYGGKSGIYKLDHKSVSGSSKDSSFLAASLPSWIPPLYWWDGYNAALASYTAYDRNRLLWNLDPRSMSFTDNTLYNHSFRFVFAFDTSIKSSNERSNLKWVYSFPRHDVVASTHTGKAMLLVSDNGTIVVLDPATGLVVSKVDLKLALKGASFDAKGFALTNRATGQASLRKSLIEVIWDPDRRFGKVKLFAVQELSKLTGADVSADLVKIVTYQKIDPAVYKMAGQMIVDRHDKKSIPLYLSTLKSHYNFLDGTTGKAVDIMARALGDLKAKEAVKPLLSHLMDHETPIPAVEEIVKSLTIIGDKSSLESFRSFLLTYRADSMFLKSSTALNLVADGLLKLGGEEERQLLRFVKNDIHTIKPLRTYLTKALEQSK